MTRKHPVTLGLVHHAQNLMPMIAVLLLEYDDRLAALGWEKRRHRSGINSYSIRKGDRQYHFRSAWPYSEIVVKDRYRQGKVVARLSGPLAVQRFMRKVAA